MKGNSMPKFVAVLLIVVILSALAFFGAEFLGIKKVADARLGIDISGGVYATLYPDVESGVTVTDEELESAKRIIGDRLDARGIFDRNLTIEKEKGRIILEIPYDSRQSSENEDAKVSDQELIDAIGQTSLLTFQEIDEEKNFYRTEEDGSVTLAYEPTNIIILDGSNVDNTQVTTYEGQLAVQVFFDSEGTEIFKEATEKYKGKKIGIFVDDYMYSAPVVNNVIPDGKPVITGDFTAQEAKILAETIKYGSLPFELEPKMINSISPTLGIGALKIAINAGLLAFILICVFMVVRYRLPGLIACLSLYALVVSTLVVVSTIRASITLPGIAGIILSVGMGVDANIIIFERIKEEIKTGKSLRASIDTGFKRAFSAILDANVTTVIVAIILYLLGTGAIKGFGITLGLGVTLSFLTAITASRIMISTISRFKVFQNVRLYGVKEVPANE